MAALAALRRRIEHLEADEMAALRRRDWRRATELARRRMTLRAELGRAEAEELRREDLHQSGAPSTGAATSSPDQTGRSAPRVPDQRPEDGAPGRSRPGSAGMEGRRSPGVEAGGCYAVGPARSPIPADVEISAGAPRQLLDDLEGGGR